jgi:hypothetical protein
VLAVTHKSHGEAILIKCPFTYSKDQGGGAILQVPILVQVLRVKILVRRLIMKAPFFLLLRSCRRAFIDLDLFGAFVLKCPNLVRVFFTNL